MIANGPWGWSCAKGFILAGASFFSSGSSWHYGPAAPNPAPISASTPGRESQGRPVDRGWTWRRLHLAEADHHFTLGIVLTALGVVFQTMAAYSRSSGPKALYPHTSSRSAARTGSEEKGRPGPTRPYPSSEGRYDPEMTSTEDVSG